MEAVRIVCQLKKEGKRLGIADSIVYATAVLKKPTFVAGDEHFKKLEDTVFHKILLK